MDYKSLLLSVFLIMTFSCSSGTPQPEVVCRGALEDILKNDLNAKIALDTLAQYSHLYGLGAGEGLQGEIVIWDGEAYLSRVAEGKVVTSNGFDHRAALMAYAIVPEWQQIRIPPHVVSYENLEKFIAEQRRFAKFDSTAASPFLITGRVGHVDWHVVDWPQDDSLHTHAKHRETGLHGRLEDQEVEIIGFYSSRHHGILTHHSTDMHLHVLSRMGNLAAHIDDVNLDGRATISPQAVAS